MDLNKDVYPEHFRIHIPVCFILEVTHFAACFLHILVGLFRWDDANNLKVIPRFFDLAWLLGPQDVCLADPLMVLWPDISRTCKEITESMAFECLDHSLRILASSSLDSQQILGHTAVIAGIEPVRWSAKLFHPFRNKFFSTRLVNLPIPGGCHVIIRKNLRTCSLDIFRK